MEDGISDLTSGSIARHRLCHRRVYYASRCLWRLRLCHKLRPLADSATDSLHDPMAARVRLVSVHLVVRSFDRVVIGRINARIAAQLVLLALFEHLLRLCTFYHPCLCKCSLTGQAAVFYVPIDFCRSCLFHECDLCGSDFAGTGTDKSEC